MTLLPAVIVGQVPLGPEFQVNVYTTGTQSIPRIASDRGALHRYLEQRRAGRSGSGAFARRYDATGAPIGAAEFQLNDFTTGSQSRPAVAAAPDGPVLFAWQSDMQDGSGLGIYARQFDGSGFPEGSEFRVNSYTVGSQRLPSIAAGGNFVVTWNHQVGFPDLLTSPELSGPSGG